MISGVDVRRHVADYIQDVESGAKVVGRCERLAVERHCRDLVDASAREWYFDEKLAAESLQFFPMVLRHTLGRWQDEPFVLEPWQSFCIWNLFGWRRAGKRTRRFRKAYLSVARKNGKTTLAAGIALLILYNDFPVDKRGQLFCTATKSDQARILWDMAEAMIKSSPYLSRQTQLRAASLKNQEYESTLKPIGLGPTHGFSPSAVFMDELHEWGQEHRKFYDALITGGAARLQPLNVIITTAGDDQCEMWCEEDDYATQVLETTKSDHVVDDRYFAYIARLDPDDDPFDESVWDKANPNLDVSVSREYLRDQANEAAQRPEQRNTFIRFHCNRRTGSREQIILPEVWDLGNGPLPDDLDKEVCYMGIDLGRSYDWSAVSVVFVVGEGPKRRFYLKQHSWTCLKGRMTVDKEPFKSWNKAGYLDIHLGDSVDFLEIDQFIRSWIEKYAPHRIAFDPTWAKEMASRIGTETGVELFEFFQTHRAYNEPVRRFVKEFAEGNIFHGNDPCLQWQVLNMNIKRNAADQWMPDKGDASESGRYKIDAAVATVMAFGEALYDEFQPLNYYDENPLEFI